MRASRITGGFSAVSIRGGGARWTPASLTGLIAWWHGDDLTGSAGDTISTWAARVGPSATQATAGVRPVVGALSSGARAAAVSDGSKWLNIASPLISQSHTAVTVLIVYQLTATGASTPSKYIVCIGNASPITTQKSLAVLARDNAGALAVGGYGQNSARAWTATTDAEQGIFGQDAVGPYAWRNGAAQTMVGGGALYNPTTAPAGPSCIGALIYGAAAYYGAPAKIREVVVTSAKPTSAEVAAWSAYTARTSGV